MGRLAIAAALCVSLSALARGAVIHVDADATGADNGSSWTDAYADLQDALTAAVTDDEIWVAEGAYLPTVESEAGLPRSKTFALVAGVALYGGFAGTEALRTERDWVAHETTLSGDIGGVGITGDNAYHVVIGADDATLDGFTVTEGNANGPDPGWKGGGMYNDAVSGLTVANCTFSDNMGDGWGGGMYIASYSTATITNCAFTGNDAPRGAGLYNRDSSPIVSGCSFTNNVADPYAAGMLNYGDSYPLITNCTFSDNTGEYYAGAMYNVYSYPTISGCTFLNNTAGWYGGAIRSWDSVTTITSCRFLGNDAPDGGGAIDNCYRSSTIDNCIFSGNTADFGGAVMNTSSSTSLANCTFSGNGALYGGGVYSGESFLTVTNCVFWGDSASGGDEICDEAGSSSSVSYSCVAGGWAGTGNVDADPLFVDTDGADDVPGTVDDDLRLQAGSPCIDAADGDAAPAVDIEGNARWDDIGLANAGAGVPTYVDMGAYESQGTTAGEQLEVWSPPAGVLLPLGTDLEIRWLATGDVPNVKVELSRDGGTSWEDIEASTANDRSHFWTVADGGQALPQPDCRIRISDAADGVPVGTSGSFAIFDGVLRVDADAPGPARDGFSWPTAFLHPQEAVDVAWAGTEIWVAEGAYLRLGGSDTVVLTMKEGVAICGGCAGWGEPDPDERDVAAHVTTLDGEDAAYHVVIGASNATLDGLTVTGGNASTFVMPDDRGAGMYNHSVAGLTVADCTFAGNTARYGGGMSNTCSSLGITICTFSGNWGTSSGGGIYNDESSPTVTDCTFSANTASGPGGGMSNDHSSPTVTGCAFSGNSGATGGGMRNFFSSPSVANCTFSGNAVNNYGGGMYNSNSSLAVTNCTFSGNTASSSGGGLGNFDVSSTTVTNCTFWGDSAPTGPEIHDSGSSCTVSYSDVQGGYGGTGNLDADPLFVDADGADDVPGTPDDDLRLQAGSPCIDAADGDAAPASDKDNLFRHDDPATANTGVGAITYADIGAHEFNGSSTGTVTGTVFLEDGADPALVTIASGGQTAVTNVVGDTIEYTIYDVPGATTEVKVETTEAGYVAVGSPALVTWVATDGSAAEATVTGHGTVTGTVFLEDGADPAPVAITADGQTATTNVVGNTIEYAIANVLILTTEVRVLTAQTGYETVGSPAAISWTGATGAAEDVTVRKVATSTPFGGGCGPAGAGSAALALFASVALRRRRHSPSRGGAPANESGLL